LDDILCGGTGRIEGNIKNSIAATAPLAAGQDIAFIVWTEVEGSAA
jgi:hypothetical protein